MSRTNERARTTQANTPKPTLNPASNPPLPPGKTLAYIRIYIYIYINQIFSTPPPPPPPTPPPTQKQEERKTAVLPELFRELTKQRQCVLPLQAGAAGADAGAPAHCLPKVSRNRGLFGANASEGWSKGVGCEELEGTRRSPKEPVLLEEKDGPGR